MPPRRHAPPAAHSGELQLVEDVLYLHSLWRRGPPQPHPKPKPRNPKPLNLRPSTSTSFKPKPNGKRKKPEPEKEWPVDPQPQSSPATWPQPAPTAPQPPPTPQPVGRAAHHRAISAAESFFKRNSDSGDDSDDENSEIESQTDELFVLFLSLFEKDKKLREYYEKNWEDGDFYCLACCGLSRKKGRGRRFRGCVGLVQHGNTAVRTGRRTAHRALARVICRVLGWDMERLPSIVLDAKEPLGKSIVMGGHDNENVNAKEVDMEEGAPSSGKNEEEIHEDVLEKEEVDMEERGSSSHKNEEKISEQVLQKDVNMEEGDFSSHKGMGGIQKEVLGKDGIMEEQDSSSKENKEEIHGEVLEKGGPSELDPLLSTTVSKSKEEIDKDMEKENAEGNSNTDLKESAEPIILAPPQELK